MQVEQQKGRLAPSVLVKPISFCVDNLVMIGESRENTVLRASSGRVSCIHKVWQQRSCHTRYVLAAAQEPALLRQHIACQQYMQQAVGPLCAACVLVTDPD